MKVWICADLQIVPAIQTSPLTSKIFFTVFPSEQMLPDHTLQRHTECGDDLLQSLSNHSQVDITDSLFFVQTNSHAQHVQHLPYYIKSPMLSLRESRGEWWILRWILGGEEGVG